MRRTTGLLLAGLLLTAWAGLGQGGDKSDDKKDDGKGSKEDGYVSLFDGKTLKGWHVSAKSGHSSKSEHKSGGKWVVEDGAIVGTQDMPGNGGLILTDTKFKDFEVVLEMRNDFGLDSGMFLRGTEDGKAYQAMVDYYEGGNLMGVYGEGLGGFHYRNFSFLDSPEKITADVGKKDKGPTPLPVSPEQWPSFWKHGEWNELKARITGNPPTVTTWIRGEKFMEWTDKEKRLPDDGAFALQVHGGAPERFFGKFVRYRNIRVKDLSNAAKAGG